MLKVPMFHNRDETIYINLGFLKRNIMSDRPRVILSAFADEAANHKSALEQLSVMAAVGLRYYSPRFVDVMGSGEVKHVVELDEAELARLIELHEEFGMSVTGIGGGSVRSSCSTRRTVRTTSLCPLTSTSRVRWPRRSACHRHWTRS